MRSVVRLDAGSRKKMIGNPKMVRKISFSGKNIEKKNLLKKTKPKNRW